MIWSDMTSRVWRDALGEPLSWDVIFNASTRSFGVHFSSSPFPVISAPERSCSYCDGPGKQFINLLPLNVGHVPWIMMSRGGKKNLWRYQRLLKVTTETCKTFYVVSCLCHLCKISEVKILLTFLPMILGQSLPSLLPGGRRELLAALWAVWLFWGCLWGTHAHVHLSPWAIGSRHPPKCAAKLFPFLSSLNTIEEGEVSSKAPPWQWSPWSRVTWILCAGERAAPLSA